MERDLYFILYVLGLIITSVSVGSLTIASYGFLTLGGGLIIYAAIIGLIKFLKPHI